VIGSLGPDLCQEDADIGECVARMARYCDAELSVGEALLDQRVACGVGNVYKSEVLWACELDPFTPVGALDIEQRTRLIEAAATQLRANLERPTRVTTTGTPEGLAVYGRFGKPCLRCATPIEVSRHGEQARVTYWCPGCQLYIPLPEREPDDDGESGDGRARRFSWRRRNRRARDDDGGDMRVGDGPTSEAELHHAELPLDPHPAAQAFMAGRHHDPNPLYLDPLLAPDA
jgi:hypothetical protein